MRVYLDELRFANIGLRLRIEPWKRAVEQKAFHGVHGVAAIDGGVRSRVLIQSGKLRAVSGKSLNSLIDEIEEKNDGREHVLIWNGDEYRNLRIDSVDIVGRGNDGVGAWCSYEIKYTQMRQD
jgi:hypothetical protein